MELLVELLNLVEAEKKKGKVTKSLRQKVYHADYVKTKHKPYRKNQKQRRGDHK